MKEAKLQHKINEKDEGILPCLYNTKLYTDNSVYINIIEIKRLHERIELLMKENQENEAKRETERQKHLESLDRINPLIGTIMFRNTFE